MSENESLGFWETTCAVVFGTVAATVPIHIHLTSMENKLYQSQKPTLEMRIENVVGGPEKEKFYEIDGKRFYLEVDGRPVEKLVYLNESRK